MDCHLAICQTNFVLDLLSTIDRSDRGTLLIFHLVELIAAGQRAFYYRGVKIWNSLSKDSKQITDANILRNF